MCPDISRVDCDPIGNGRWACNSGVIGSAAPGTLTPSIPIVPVALVVPIAPVNPTVPIPDGKTTGKVKSNDLVSLNYDNCPDRDDGHALAAGKAVIVRAGLVNIRVINGTCASDICGSYQAESEAVADAVWGSQWLDYYNAGEAAIQSTAQSRAAVLANGSDVWVAEGGPSDFTADVLKRIISQIPH